MGRIFVDKCLQLCIAVLISSPCAPAAVFAASKTFFTAAGNLHLHQSSVLRRASFEPMRIRGGAYATEPTEMPPQDTLVLHYHSTWPTVHIHYSLDGGKTWSVRPGKRQDEAAVIRPEVVDPALGPSPVGPAWRSVTIPAAGPVAFVLHNGAGAWDSAPRGGGATFYTAAAPGVFALRDAVLSPVRRAARVLVVSDLDGTLVGDEGALAEFKGVWERQCGPRGSVLVYNTGRSINSTLALIKEQGLLIPTAVIASVGTEVWWSAYDSSGRVCWTADAAWEAGLQGGGRWDRDLVCRLAGPHMAKGWMHFRPEDEQNRHKAVFGVRTERVADVIRGMRAGLEAEGRQGQFIASGHGDWNYMDVVCEGAGKLEATVHVRRKLGFAINATVACGDSGNDILMLSGEERGVVVGNAQAGLVDWLREHGDGAGRIYRARAHHARGVLEGLRSMGFVTD